MPAVSTAAGGAKGGGTSLTPVGEELVRRYRAVEEIALAAASAELRRLTHLIAP